MPLAVPPIRQATAYSCGPACLRSVMSYFDLPPMREAALRRLCRTTKKGGTQPEKLAAGAKDAGFRVWARRNASLDWLARHLADGRPVICLVQAHGGGHYLIVTGLDVGAVWVIDPSLDNVNAWMKDDFLAAWHDRHGDTEYRRWSMALEPESRSG